MSVSRRRSSVSRGTGEAFHPCSCVSGRRVGLTSGVNPTGFYGWLRCQLGRAVRGFVVVSFTGPSTKGRPEGPTDGQGTQRKRPVKVLRAPNEVRSKPTVGFTWNNEGVSQLCRGGSQSRRSKVRSVQRPGRPQSRAPWLVPTHRDVGTVINDLPKEMQTGSMTQPCAQPREASMRMSRRRSSVSHGSGDASQPCSCVSGSRAGLASRLNPTSSFRRLRRHLGGTGLGSSIGSSTGPPSGGPPEGRAAGRRTEQKRWVKALRG